MVHFSVASEYFLPLCFICYQEQILGYLKYISLERKYQFFHPYETAGGIVYCYDFIPKLKDLKSGAGEYQRYRFGEKWNIT